MDSHRWRRRLGTFLAVLLVTLLAISIPSVSTHVQQQPLRVQLRWLPQAQFTGFYVAKDHDSSGAKASVSLWNLEAHR